MKFLALLFATAAAATFAGCGDAPTEQERQSPTQQAAERQERELLQRAQIAGLDITGGYSFGIRLLDADTDNFDARLVVPERALVEGLCAERRMLVAAQSAQSTYNRDRINFPDDYLAVTCRLPQSESEERLVDSSRDRSGLVAGLIRSTGRR